MYRPECVCHTADNVLAYAASCRRKWNSGLCLTF